MVHQEFIDQLRKIVEDYVVEAKEHEDNFTDEAEKRIRDFLLYCEETSDSDFWD